MSNNTSIKPAIGAYIAFLITGTLVGFVPATIFILSEVYNVSFSYINIIMSVIGIGRIISLFISGVIADKYGSKRIMVIAVLLSAVFYAILPINNNIYIAFALSFVAGISFGMIDASATKLIFDCYPEKSGFAIGLIQVFFCLGASICPFITGLLISNDIYFGWLFWGFAVLCILDLIYILNVNFPKHRVIEEKDKVVLGIFSPKNKNFRDAIFAWVALLAYSIASSVFFAWGIVYAKEIVGLSEANAIQIPLYFNIGAIVSGYIIGKLIDKIHVTTFFIASPTVFLFTFAYFIIFKPQQQIMYILLFCFTGLVAGITPSYVVSITGKIFPDNQGAASGLTMSMLAMGLIFTPIITGLIFNMAGVVPVMYFGCVVFVISIVFAIISKIKFGKLKI